MFATICSFIAKNRNINHISKMSGGRKSRRNAQRRRFGSIEQLERREMMAADVGANWSIDGAQLPVVLDLVPAYSSNTGAPATLYLDFNGHNQDQWGSYSDAVTPVFDLDNTDYFSLQELKVIKEVWQRVAEDFAPFNINVTTVNPGDFSDGKALRVAIGGSWQDWYGASAGGVAYGDSFTNSNPNVVYVFSDVLYASGENIADVASHEAGHAFGLAHQSKFDARGGVVEEYLTGSSEKGPLMGNAYPSERTTWWYGTVGDDDGPPGYVMQDDMAVIASDTNGFGYRADDFGNSYQTATSLGLSSTGKIAGRSGIIATTSDRDWFKLQVTTPGTYSFQANVAQVGANLDARLSLVRVVRLPLVTGGWVDWQSTIASFDSASSLNASLTAQLAAGTYYVVVDSHGEFGDVGQYTLQGTGPSIGTGRLFAGMTSPQPTFKSTMVNATMAPSTGGSPRRELLASTVPITVVPTAALLPPKKLASLQAEEVDTVMGDYAVANATAPLAEVFDLLATSNAMHRAASDT